MAIYDDHDYGVDNGDSSYAHRQASLSLFNEYFRSIGSDGEGSGERRTNGVYTSKLIRLGGRDRDRDRDRGREKEGEREKRDDGIDSTLKGIAVKVIMLDTRFNKSPAGTPKGEGKML